MRWMLEEMRPNGRSLDQLGCALEGDYGTQAVSVPWLEK
jgi:hypothetical protein